MGGREQAVGKDCPRKAQKDKDLESGCDGIRGRRPPVWVFDSRCCIWRQRRQNVAMTFLHLRKNPSLFAQLEMIESFHYVPSENDESSRLVIHFVSGKIEAIVGKAAIEANDIILKRLAGK